MTTSSCCLEGLAPLALPRKPNIGPESSGAGRSGVGTFAVLPAGQVMEAPMSAARTLVRLVALPLVVVAAVGCSSTSDDATTTTAKAAPTTAAAAPTSEAASGDVNCAKVAAAATSLQGLGAQAEQIGNSGDDQASMDAQFQQVVTQAKEEIRVIDRQARLAGTDPAALSAYTQHNRQLVVLFEQLVEDNDSAAFQQGLAAITTPEFEQAQTQVSAALKAACPSLTPG